MRLVFMGSPELAVPSLQGLIGAGYEVALVVTQPDRPSGRGLKLAPSPVALAASKLRLNIAKPHKALEAAEQLTALKPDFMVVVAFGQILPEAVLQIAPAINLHTSLLPFLRGAAPINRAIMAGQELSGVSTMLMDKGLDTGPILLQQKIKIAPDDTALSLGQRMSALGPMMLIETLEGLKKGEIALKPQNEQQASYAARLNKQEGLLDWRQSAESLDCRVRGLYPWPGTYVSVGEGSKLKLFPPTRLLTDNYHCPPGSILNYRVSLPAPVEDMLVVACGLGALALGAAQMPGKKVLPGAELARWLLDQGIESL